MRIELRIQILANVCSTSHGCFLINWFYYFIVNVWLVTDVKYSDMIILHNFEEVEEEEQNSLSPGIRETGN